MYEHLTLRAGHLYYLALQLAESNPVKNSVLVSCAAAVKPRVKHFRPGTRFVQYHYNYKK